ncbi:hypothetical protein [Trujillonella humicola]|uniref:hypothetical protein n=1 Tax=Trujillonella humicola TaxID=3383699 RepID=UPI003906D46F
MAGSSRTTGSRIGARFARLGAIGVIAALMMIFTPGTASASGTVTPIVDCYRYNGDGTYWIVLGYSNTTGSQKTYPYGTANQVYPTRLQGQQPRQFAAGTVHGTWRVLLTHSEIFYQDARWILNGQTLRYSYYVQYATVCPPTTVLPADGNGTGTAVALGAAGAVGAAVLYRFRRKLARLEAGPPAAGAA